MPDTVPGFLERAAALGDERAGITCVDRREQARHRSWTAIRDGAARAAGALREAGVTRGDRVVLLLPTRPEFFDAWLGAQWIGAVPVALYPPVRLGRLEEYHARTARMLEVSGAAAVVTEPRIRRLLGRVAERFTPRSGFHDVEALGAGRTVPRAPQSADDLAMVQFSSGTTVDPKPVALTHRQILANADRITDQIRARLEPGDGSVPTGASWLPLYHDMGLIGCVLPALLHPGALWLLPPELFLARPGLWLRMLSRSRAIVSPAPNFGYALTLERARDDELEGVDLSHWRLALNGAEPVSPQVMRAFERRFAPYGFREDAMMPVYGLSEIALAATFPPPGRRFRTTWFDREELGQGLGVVSMPGAGAVELPSVGRPLPDFGIEIRDDEAKALPDRRVGRVWVSGPSLMKGYLGREDGPIVDGWLDTGDVGLIHEGELYVTGRAKDLLILRGRNHAPQDIEAAADRVPGVRTGCSAAVGEVDAEGEKLILFVEARRPSETLADEVRRAVLAATALEASLVVVLDPGTLPRTSSGKVRRAEALRQWRAGALLPPDAVDPIRLAGALARSQLAWLRARWRR